MAPLYRTGIPKVKADEGPLSGADMFTFTSASTVDNFFELLGERAAPLLAGAQVAAIGPITAQALAVHAVAVAVVPAEYTTTAMVEAIRAHFATQGPLP